MKGRRAFSANELHAIELTLGEARASDASRRRRLHDALRRHYHFYVSDFSRRGSQLTVDEVERLVAQGVIHVYV